MINIRNFTNKTADIVIGYLGVSPPLFNEREDQHAEKTRHHFRVIWEGIVWYPLLKVEIHDAELFLRQIFYLGSEMQPYIREVFNANNKPKYLAPDRVSKVAEAMPKIMKTTRFVYQDPLFKLTAHPFFLALARSLRGRKLLKEINTKLVEHQRCLVIFKAPSSRAFTYDDPLFDMVGLSTERIDYTLATPKSNNGLWYLTLQSIDSALFHELSHVMHSLNRGKAIPCIKKSWRWTDEEERITIEEENAFTAESDGPQSLTHKGCVVENRMELFEKAIRWGADGTICQMLEAHRVSFVSGSNRRCGCITPARLFQLCSEYPKKGRVFTQNDALFFNAIHARKLLIMRRVKEYAVGEKLTKFVKEFDALVTRKARSVNCVVDGFPA